MKQTISKAIAMILAIFTLCASLTGCTGMTQDTEAVSCAVVYAVRRNFPVPDASFGSAADMIGDTVLSYGSVSTVLADGTPRVIDTVTIDDSGLSSGKMKSIASQIAASVVSNAYASVPAAAECDTLQAISLAARTLSDKDGKRIMLVIDNGLSTAGVLNFAAEPLLATPAEEIVDQLSALKAIPDLRGIEVIWYGLGETEAPQTKLSDQDRTALEEIWSAILTAAQTSHITISKEAYAAEPLDKSAFPAVSVVESIPASVKGVESVPAPAPEPPSVPVLTEVRRFDSASVAFKPSSVELIDPAAAQAALREVVDHLKENPVAIVIAGSTATADTLEKCRAFSKQRAETVKALLVEMGVDPSLVTTVGLGYDRNPYHTPDLDADGRLIEAAAQQNRCVYIVAAESDAGRQLLQ